MKRVAFFIPLIFSFLMTINFYAYSADINLNTGWNLISLNNQPTDTDISSVLSSISGKYVSVWAYIDGGWKVYDPENPGFSDLTTMEVGRGYWINMSEFANLPVLGIAPSNSLDLSSGWNLVGYNSSTSQAVADELASIEGKYISVWAYMDGDWKVYDPANPGFSDLNTMEPGYGYWIYARETCEWEIPATGDGFLAWHIENVRADEVWSLSKGEGIVVAVMDSGIYVDHRDLKNQLWENSGEIPDNGIDDDQNGYIDDIHGWNFHGDNNDVNDEYYHGTMVSGLIAAEASNLGTVGVAYKSKIMVLKVRGASQNDWASVDKFQAAIEYAVNNGAKVINMSIEFGDLSAENDEMFEEMCEYAHSNGVVLVSAAGNNSIPVPYGYPAREPEVISVGASTSDNRIALLSNRGPIVDLTAPGYDVITTSIESMASITDDGEPYIQIQGTSFAAPIVSAAAALILAKYPNYSPEMVRSALRNSAVDLGPEGFDYLHGFGRLDIRDALGVSNPLEAKISYPLPAQKLQSQDSLSIKGYAGGNGFVSYTIEYGLGSHPDENSWQTILSSEVNGSIERDLATWTIPANIPNDFSVITIRLTVEGEPGELFCDYVPIYVDNFDPELLMAGLNPGYGRVVTGSTIYRFPSVGDVDPENPGLEVLTTSCSLLYGWTSSGERFLRDSINTTRKHIPVSVYNLDEQGGDEIVVQGVEDLHVYTYDSSNQILTQIWGKESITNFLYGYISSVDLNSDSYKDILFLSSDCTKLLGFDRMGNQVFEIDNTAFFPDDSYYLPLNAGAAIVGEVAGYTYPVLTYSTRYRLLAVDGDGQLLFSPQELENLLYSPPLVGDVNQSNDGEMEIVTVTTLLCPIGTCDGGPISERISIWDLLGNELFSWQVRDTTEMSEMTSYFGSISELYAKNYGPGIALADISSEKPGLEIIVATGNKVYVYSYDGEPMPGWPQDITFGTAYNIGTGTGNWPVVGDLDGDGNVEIIVGSEYGAVFAWSKDGDLRYDLGFPIVLSSPITGTSSSSDVPKALQNSSLLTDLNQDGKIDLVVVADTAYTYTFNGPADGNIQWPQYGHDTTHSFNYHMEP